MGGNMGRVGVRSQVVGKVFGNALDRRFGTVICGIPAAGWVGDSLLGASQHNRFRFLGLGRQDEGEEDI